MPSKTSKKPRGKTADQAQHRSKQECLCSEHELESQAHELWLAIRNALPTSKRAIFVSLEGEMGAGKSTFARALLSAEWRMSAEIRPENRECTFKGSPTFAIAHEYFSGGVEFIHTDLYRLKNENELREAGIEAFFWERGARVVVLVEWLAMFPELEQALIAECVSSERVGYRVKLEFVPNDMNTRRLQIECLN